MTAEAPFNWIDSNGWLVLSGPPDALSELRAQALSRCDGAGAIAYISLAPDLGDALMDDMAELGAAAGYLVDLEATDNNLIYERLIAAAMIVIEAAQNAELLERLMTQTVRSALKSALQQGALIMFEGAAAGIAGEHRVTAERKLSRGLNLVSNALITMSAENEWLPDIHHELPDVSIIGLARGAALALGPGRRIETWGDAQVTISLPDPARLGAIRSDDSVSRAT